MLMLASLNQMMFFLFFSPPNRLIEYVVLQDPQEKSIKPVFLGEVGRLVQVHL